MNNTLVNFILDTGAQANDLPHQQYLRLKKRPKLKEAKVTLSAYNNSPIPTKGSCILSVERPNEKSIPVRFVVAEIESPLIIGLKSCQHLNLIKRINVVKKQPTRVPDYVDDYLDCFGRLGCFSKPHHIYTNPDVRPTVCPAMAY